MTLCTALGVRQIKLHKVQENKTCWLAGRDLTNCTNFTCTAHVPYEWRNEILLHIAVFILLTPLQRKKNMKFKQNEILTDRRVATCKPGKPRLTSFSETLALFFIQFLSFVSFQKLKVKDRQNGPSKSFRGLSEKAGWLRT